ncbi:MAG: glycosyltransferase family 87 protein [Streptosporangiaceae bacterium]
MARSETRGERIRATARDSKLAVTAGSVTALVIASLAGSSLGFLNKAACRAGAWNIGVAQYQAHCYTDIYPLYFGEGLWRGQVPYLHHQVEYPVLIGAAMQAAAWVVRPITDASLRGREFFDVTVAGLVLCAIVGVLATACLAGRSHRWTALLVALSPALILTSFINWDLIAMALTAVAMAAWAGRKGVLAGVLFGLAIATKFYPIVLLAALFPLCLRAGRLRSFWVTAGSAVVAWLVVNLPVAIGAFPGWSRFYRLNSTRGADWGSIWYLFEARRWPVLGTMGLGTLNLLSLFLFVVAFALIGMLILAAPRRPRLPQAFFLVLAAFLLVNKVWSPQYVIWLVPLAVLARPRLWSYVLWQVAEAGYFFAIWAYLIPQADPSAPGGIGGLYFVAVLARFAAVALLCALVVKDILRPGTDVVRMRGEDDPAGGVLAGAPDAVTRRRPVAQPWEYPSVASS